VWDVESGRELRTLKGWTGEIKAVALSADGQRVVSGSDDRTLKVWDVESGQCLRTLQGHVHRVKAVALSADGRWAASGSSDHTLKVWDVESGQCLATFTGEGAIDCCALASDGRTIVADESFGRVHSLRLVLPEDPV
jgi:WD40 repeat protein